jgi:hypothetical protein
MGFWWQDDKGLEIQTQKHQETRTATKPDWEDTGRKPGNIMAEARATAALQACQTELQNCKMSKREHEAVLDGNRIIKSDIIAVN